LKLATAAEKVQAAKALEESYVAEQKAEAARAEESVLHKTPILLYLLKLLNKKRLLKQRLRQKKSDFRQKERLMLFLQNGC
jgi:flotillin